MIQFMPEILRQRRNRYFDKPRNYFIRPAASLQHFDLATLDFRRTQGRPSVRLGLAWRRRLSHELLRRRLRLLDHGTPRISWPKWARRDAASRRITPMAQRMLPDPIFLFWKRHGAMATIGETNAQIHLRPILRGRGCFGFLASYIQAAA